MHPHDAEIKAKSLKPDQGRRKFIKSSLIGGVSIFCLPLAAETLFPETVNLNMIFLSMFRHDGLTVSFAGATHGQELFPVQVKMAYPQ